MDSGLSAPAAGWVDCQSPEFDHLDEMICNNGATISKGCKGVRLSRAEVFRLVKTDHGKGYPWR